MGNEYLLVLNYVKSRIKGGKWGKLSRLIHEFIWDGIQASYSVKSGNGSGEVKIFVYGDCVGDLLKKQGELESAIGSADSFVASNNGESIINYHHPSSMSV